MKRVPLRTVELVRRGREAPVRLDYGEIMCLVLEYTPRQSGITLSEIRKRTPVLDRVEGAMEREAEFVRLEDEHHRVLVQALRGYPFGFAHPAIVEMADAIEGAPVATDGEMDDDGE